MKETTFVKSKAIIHLIGPKHKYLKVRMQWSMSLRGDAPHVKELCQNLRRVYVVMGNHTLFHFGFIGVTNMAIGSIENAKASTLC